ncbi:MAG: LemA family protein [candidate division FCPU426 bacterium]
MKRLLFLVLSVAMLSLSGCGVRSIPMSRNAVDAAAAEITNQYKRRADLIPNLVEVVKGYAKHEKTTLESVVSARANATAMTIDPSKATPAELARYANAQGQLSQALGRLLAISENYPNLKADANFRDLQAQLEGSENRITIARQRYIAAINDFNNQIGVFPSSIANSLFFHHSKLPQWDLEASEKKAVEKAPEVKF